LEVEKFEQYVFSLLRKNVGYMLFETKRLKKCLDMVIHECYQVGVVL